MIDLENMVKDELETTHGIEDLIEEELGSAVSLMVEQWVRKHNLRSWISDALEQAITEGEISEAVESAIESFIEDAF